MNTEQFLSVNATHPHFPHAQRVVTCLEGWIWCLHVVAFVVIAQKQSTNTHGLLTLLMFHTTYHMALSHMIDASQHCALCPMTKMSFTENFPLFFIFSCNHSFLNFNFCFFTNDIFEYKSSLYNQNDCTFFKHLYPTIVCSLYLVVYL